MPRDWKPSEKYVVRMQLKGQPLFIAIRFIPYASLMKIGCLSRHLDFVQGFILGKWSLQKSKTYQRKADPENPPPYRQWFAIHFPQESSPKDRRAAFDALIADLMGEDSCIVEKVKSFGRLMR